MNISAKLIVSFVCIGLLAGCADVPDNQTMKLASANEQGLTLGVKGTNRTANIENHGVINGGNNMPQPLVSHFYASDGTCLMRNEPSLVFPSVISSLEDGAAIVAGFGEGSFPNTQNALEGVRQQFAEQTGQIDLRVNLGPVVLSQDGLFVDGEHAVGGIYEPQGLSLMVVSLVGVPGAPGPIALVTAGMGPTKVNYSFANRDDCLGDHILSYPFETTLGSFHNVVNPNDQFIIDHVSIAALAIALVADTAGRELSYCIRINDHVAIIPDGDSTAYSLSDETPDVAVITTGSRPVICS